MSLFLGRPVSQLGREVSMSGLKMFTRLSHVLLLRGVSLCVSRIQT
jgi:hypothetical protein